MNWTAAINALIVKVSGGGLRTGQRTWCYCPGCDRDLCSNDEAGIGWAHNDEVMYVCPCGMRSWWDFGAPVPLLLRHGKGVAFRLSVAAERLRRERQ